MRNRRLAYCKYRMRYWIDLILQWKLKIPCSGVTKIVGKNFLSDETANQIIIEAIKSNKPFCLLRPGNVEYEFVVMKDYSDMKAERTFCESKIYDILDKNDEQAERWVSLFKQDFEDADIIACFSRKAYSEFYLMEMYSHPQYIIQLKQLECMHLSHPWTLELKDKKVLVVSPFAETMKEQYQKRELIWQNKEVLPDMDVHFFKAVWYLDKENNNGFENWFEALEYMYAQIKKIDFEIALLGCGPFGTFLATRIKRDGKQAIQYGGALQMLFGVRGARWDEMDYYKPFMNEHWVRPSLEETPKENKRLDGGCYW